MKQEKESAQQSHHQAEIEESCDQVEESRDPAEARNEEDAMKLAGSHWDRQSGSAKPVQSAGTQEAGESSHGSGSAEKTEVSRDRSNESRDPTEEPRDPTEEPRDPTEESRDPTRESRDPTRKSRGPTEETSRSVWWKCNLL